MARGHPVVVLVSAVDRRIVPAIRFVSRLPLAEARALHVSVDAEVTRQFLEDWMRLDLTWLPLHVREAPSGHVANAVRAAIDEQPDRYGTVTIVVPELNVPRWWHPLLHRQDARRIAAQLQDVPGATTVIVPFTLDDP
ncbi:MAG TPA: hypothetical protein VF230_12905 [Acidimicrobiales bacterium]